MFSRCHLNRRLGAQRVDADMPAEFMWVEETKPKLIKSELKSKLIGVKKSDKTSSRKLPRKVRTKMKYAKIREICMIHIVEEISPSNRLQEIRVRKNTFHAFHSAMKER